jgi:hypothetical protein
MYPENVYKCRSECGTKEVAIEDRVQEERAPLQRRRHRLPFAASAPRQIVLEINKLLDTFLFLLRRAFNHFIQLQIY